MQEYNQKELKDDRINVQWDIIRFTSYDVLVYPIYERLHKDGLHYRLIQSWPKILFQGNVAPRRIFDE